jgi:hypothetical protein
MSPLIAGIILYAISFRLSNLICRGLDPPQSPASDLRAGELHGIAFAVAGLAIVALKFPDVVSVIWQIKQTAQFNDREAEYLTNPRFLSEMAVLVLGVSLFLGARFWANLYRWFQEFGLENK